MNDIGGFFMKKTIKYTLKKFDLNETTVDNMLGKHSDAGYIIITAFRGGDSDPDVLKHNYKNNARLKSDIKASGYSFTPVWGGFYEVTSDKVVKEQSFIVFNFKGKIKQNDSRELKALGQKLCKKYDQEAFFYKEDGGYGYYIESDGTVGMKFKNVEPTTASDIYFTSLNKSRKKQIGNKSLTFKEGFIYLAKSPNSLYEAYLRSGEIFLSL